MRGHNIFTGTLLLLIFSTINFALAAPVLVQEERQEGVSITNAPKGVTTVLGKRWDQELEKLGEEYFKTPGKLIDSSGTHSSSISTPYPASSTSNLDQSTEPCCPPPMQGISARGNTCWKSCLQLMDDLVGVDIPLFADGGRSMLFSPPRVTSHEFPSYGTFPTTKAPVPQSMWLEEPNPWAAWRSADPDPWAAWRSADIPPLSPPTPPRPPLIAEDGQPSGYAPSPPLTKSVVPSPSLGAPDHQSAAYKGKGVMGSRGIHGTTRDAENAAQRELQSAERSLDPGEY